MNAVQMHPMTEHEILLMNSAARSIRSAMSKNVRSPEARNLVEVLVQDFCVACEQDDDIVVAKTIPLSEAGNLAKHFLRTVLKDHWKPNRFDQYISENASWSERIFQFRKINKDRKVFQEFVAALQAATR